MRVLYAITCEDASPRDDGRVDLHGVFHQLYAPGFPARQDRMVLALTVEWGAGESGRQLFRIDLLDPSRTPALTINGHTDVSAARDGEPPPQTRLVMPLEGIIFPSAGTYLFQLHLGSEVLLLAPLHLVEDPAAS